MDLAAADVGNSGRWVGGRETSVIGKEALAFPRLFSPLSIGNLTLRNRIIFGPHQTRFSAYADAFPPPELADYLAARARGGVGMVITGASMIAPNSLRLPILWVPMYREEAPVRWRPIVDAVHAEGVPIICQLMHLGRQGSPFSNRDEPTWAPSPLPCPIGRDTPKAMEAPDFEEVVAGFVNCAAAARAAGFDGVELHSAHGYLLSSFLSPNTNLRDDEYGGSIDNRMRLLLRIVAGVRAEIGDDAVLGVRMVSSDRLPGGLEIPESIQVAQALEATGKIDYLNVSQGVRGSQEFIRAPMFIPPAYALNDTAHLTRAVELPVFGVGRIVHPDYAEEAISENKVNAVILVRPLIADPDWANKARDGQAAEIRRCIGAGDCVSTIQQGVVSGCIYNGQMGREGSRPIKPAAAKRRVLVIGAGPAGMEAARVASLRGHEVALLDANDEVGGLLRMPANTQGRREIREILDYYARQLPKVGVRLQLDTRADVATVLAEQPDDIVLATGSLPRMPPDPSLPALDAGPNAPLRSVTEAFHVRWLRGQRVIVCDEDPIPAGLTVADHLATLGVEVTYLSNDAPGTKLDIPTRRVWLKRLGGMGVRFLPMHRVSAIDDGAGPRTVVATVVPLFGGEPIHMACEGIIYCIGRRSETLLYDDLTTHFASSAPGEPRPRIHRIGDCLAPRSSMFAVHDGYTVGTSI